MIEEVSIPTREIEADGFITPSSALERKNEKTAKPISDCLYPKCEECDSYHGHYCTVPIVVSKQMYIVINDKINDLFKRVNTLEDILLAEILGDKE